ncbi:PqqD family protein [Ancylobacter dichloromethanicus]|uniref:PqqD family protein n=1 Tax=Ancylobacter dichloromethanicus TaxID=518825 RepID=A0A9W6MZC8_9HYPH|nr:PqqD family protein [Ancylobacter dichloromethanicus]MBS7554812.1 PqqD family protein [Ancylobacter dichloromethanicus]GLK71877.1 hypothetical protein GCM10017643_19930 [Ancylobacter dichloromethanicus]
MVKENNSGKPRLADCTLIAHASNLITAYVDEELMIVNSQTGNFIQLNASASNLWQRIEAPIALGTLCDRITEQYDVSREECRSHVVEWLGQMHALGLVELETN